METLIDLLRVSATRHGRRTAFKMKAGFRVERWPYAHLARFAGRMAAYLKERGLNKGDRVVICAPNQPAWAGAFLGCLSRGATGRSESARLRVQSSTRDAAQAHHWKPHDGLPAVRFGDRAALA